MYSTFRVLWCQCFKTTSRHCVRRFRSPSLRTYASHLLPPYFLLSVVPTGLQGCRRFRSSAVDYSSVLLEADSQRLYVGARGAVFALNASDISSGLALKVSLFCLCGSMRVSLYVCESLICIVHPGPFPDNNISWWGKRFFPCHLLCVWFFILFYWSHRSIRQHTFTYECKHENPIL